jgi:hypothetical protein
MSFKVFIYYCGLAGGWAAFLAWACVAVLGLDGGTLHAITRSAGIAAVLGLFVAAAIGLVDALLNAVGMQRLVRVMLCGVLGLVGGALGGLLGGVLYYLMPDKPLLMLPGWVLVGTLIGGSIGAFDVARAMSAGDEVGPAFRKLLNGLMGGFLGGFIGGLPFILVFSSGVLYDYLPHGALTLGLVLLGICIGLMIGLAQVILKQAWIRVEEGFRPGRELLLTKDETTIGRAESCDLGLFGDNMVQKLHARIVREKNRYVLVHAAEDGETLVNDEEVRGKSRPLRAGDLIRLGRNVLRFGERDKRR